MWLYFRMNFHVKIDSFLFFFAPISLAVLRAVQKWEPGARHRELGNFYSGAEVPDRQQCVSVLAISGAFFGNVVVFTRSL